MNLTKDALQHVSCHKYFSYLMNKYNAILLYKTDAVKGYGWDVISTQLDYLKHPSRK